jgi:hypothetical protein
MPVVEVHLFIQGNWSDSDEVQKVIENFFIIHNIFKLNKID